MKISIPKDKKIVIAMSGGVDSSVAAALLKEQGYGLIGVSLQLWNYSWDTDHRFGTCCSLDDLADARRVAEKVGIPHYIVNLEKEFRREVVDYFISEYMQARTPIPCTACNKKLKFDELMNKAQIYGYDYVATGHYASVIQDEHIVRHPKKSTPWTRAPTAVMSRRPARSRVLLEWNLLREPR